jgi:glycerophosphoryl diester phosphodiesterase
MKPTIIAHRGNNYSYPENTLAGLRSAFELGCLAVEFDIQMTVDGVLAIIHDTKTKRTSDKNLNVFKESYQELSTVSVHEPKKFSEQHNPTPISRLEDFFPLLDQFPQGHAYIEVKKESLSKWGHQELLNILLPLVNQYKDQCTIISFDLEVLELIKEQSPLKIGWVLNHYNQRSLDDANRVKPEFLIIDQAQLSLKKTPWQGTWEWMVYGVDNADLAFAHYNNGVQHVETDHLPILFNDPRLKP